MPVSKTGCKFFTKHVLLQAHVMVSIHRSAVVLLGREIDIYFFKYFLKAQTVLRIKSLSVIGCFADFLASAIRKSRVKEIRKKQAFNIKKETIIYKTLKYFN